jgi:hypothetical protein
LITVSSPIMSSHDNGKLVATAIGAAAAGAGLAVLAMKMIESNSEKKKSIKYSAAAGYYPYDRPPRTSVLMNDPKELENMSSAAADIHRESSERMLFPHNHEEKMKRRIATRYTIEEDNTKPRNSVTVRVPATSANVGPGCTFLAGTMKSL